MAAAVADVDIAAVVAAAVNRDQHAVMQHQPGADVSTPVAGILVGRVHGIRRPAAARSAYANPALSCPWN